MIGGLFDTYEEYLLSDMWIEKSRSIIADTCKCEVCGVPNNFTFFTYDWIHKNMRSCKNPALCNRYSKPSHWIFSKKLNYSKSLVVHHLHYFSSTSSAL